MTSKSTAGVTLSADQGLTNSSIEQDGTSTTLTFTRLLVKENYLTINDTGGNYFLWAIGSSNTLGYHLGRGSFVVDLSASCGGAEESMVEESTITEPSTDCQASDNADYNSMILLQGDGTGSGDVAFYYSVVGDSLSAQVVYNGAGWVAWAISPDGMMVGADAVIGLPDEANGANNPGHYDMTSKSTAGVTLSADQGLSDASITQDDTSTTLTFSRPLMKDNYRTIDNTGENIFLWAVGSSNMLGYHLGG